MQICTVQSYYNPSTVPVLPSANPVLENISSVYPFYVYDGNRPLAPILRQRRCSLLYDVYWIAWWWCLTGSKYLEYNPGSELNIYWLNMKTEQWNRIEQKNLIEWNTACKSNKSQTINQTILNNNNWQWALFTTQNKITIVIWKGWNVTVQHLHRVKIALRLQNRQLQSYLPQY